MLFSVPSRGFHAATVLSALLFAAGLVGSTAVQAQSIPGDPAPWQAHPGPRGVSAVEEFVDEDDSCDSCNGGACDRECGYDFGPCSWFGIFQPHDRLSFRGEYLALWSKSARSPNLLAGNLAGTDILAGGSDIDLGARSGARFTLGYWLNPCHDFALDVNYMFLSEGTASFGMTSDGSQTLTRPFYNVKTALPDAAIIAYDDQQTGEFAVNSTSELASVEVLFRKVLFQQPCRQLDFLVGYRYARLHENLAIDESTTYTSTVGDVPVGTVFDISDDFDAKNEFNGAEFGFVAKTRNCRWSLELLAKLALGRSQSQVGVSGATRIAEPDQAVQNYKSGMLALGTNRGDYSQSSFAVMPELGATLGYDLTSRLKATVGYTFLYWSQVARPGDQIDTNLNPTQFPPGTLSGVASPQCEFKMTDYWAQGINVGLDYRF